MMGRFRIRLGLVFVLFLTLIACGGDDNSSGTSPDGAGVGVDRVPEAFSFIDQVDLALSTTVISNEITVSGINTQVAIAVTDGEYSVDGGSYTASEGTVSNGQSVTLRQVSSDSFSTTTDAVLTIGSISDTFSVTTSAEDSTPDLFSFTDLTGVAQNTLMMSNPITVLGINTMVPISITGGEYSLDGASYTASAGTVSNAQTVTIRQTSSNSFSTATDAVLTIGGVSDTFSVTTWMEDSTPDLFSFTDLTEVARNTVLNSNPITVLGINTTVPISITDGEYSLDGASYTASAGTVSNAQTVTIRQTSSNSFSTATDAVLTIGGVSDTFSVTTLAADSTPDLFSFTDLSDVGQNAIVESNVITVSGINTSVSISVSGGEYSIDGGAFTGSAGIVANGQSVKVRQTSSSELSATSDAVLMISTLSDTFSVTTAATDISAPMAAILFPASQSLTEGDSLTVRGTAKDTSTSTITAVRVNGVDVSTTDGYATWSITVALSIGTNHLTVETSDNQSNTNPAAASAVVERDSGFMMTPASLALDAANNRVLVTDYVNRRLLETNLTTGERSIIADDNIGSGPSLGSAKDVVLDSANNRAIVLDDSTFSVLFAVDLNTGARTEITGFSVGSGPYIQGGRSLVLDTANNRALLPSIGQAGVMAVDLSSGDRTIISRSNPNAGPDIGSGPILGWPISISLDSANNRVLVVAFNERAIFAVDLNTGDRTILSDNDGIGSGPDFTNMGSAVYDEANNRLLVLDVTSDSLIEVDLSNGDRTIISNNDTGSGPDLDKPEGITLDTVNNRAYLVSSPPGALFEVDLSNGNRSLVSQSVIGSGPRFDQVEALALDHANRRALIAGTGPNGIMTLDVNTGERAIISDNGNGYLYFMPREIVLDADQNRVMVADNFTGMIETDLVTGDTRQISFTDSFDPENNIGNGPAFTSPQALRLDAANDRALWLQIGAGGGALLAVDLLTGDRVILANDDTGSGDNFDYPADFALDNILNRALVIDRELQALLAVDLSTGDRSILSNSSIGSGPDFISPGLIALDSHNNRALVNEGFSMVAVNLSNGNRSILMDRTVGNGPTLYAARSLELGAEGDDLLWVLGGGGYYHGINTLYLVDLQTGDRVIVSK